MSRARLGAIVLALLPASGIAVVVGADGVTQASAASCVKDGVQAAISAKPVCLRAGQRCSKRLDRQYHMYWFHCHSGRLKSPPRAGKVIASIPVPAVGGLAIGAGSVWVANMNPRTVTRIDPQTNAVVATIPLGEPDFLWGPTRLAFGHGSLWVLDAKSSSALRIDPESNRVIAAIELGSPTQVSTSPLGIAVTPDAVWVTNTWGSDQAPDGSVVRIDPSTNEAVLILGLGVSPSGGGPRGLAAGADALWAAVPSMRSLARIDSATGVVTEVPGLTCGEGQLALHEANVWVADCTGVRRVDARTSGFTGSFPMPRATGQGVLGIAVGLGSIWVQAGPLVRMNPVTGAISGVLSLAPIWNDCAYSIAFGFDSVWVRQHDAVVRIRP